MTQFEADRAAPLSALIITDGKMGDLQPCRGVAQALAAEVTEIRVTPHRWSAFIGHTPFDQQTQAVLDAMTHQPTLILGSGRRAAPYLKKLKARWHGQPLTVFLKDPRTGQETADLIWVPSHDKWRGSNTVVTPTSPHPHTAARQQEAGEALVARLNGLPRPWLGVLLGGTTKRTRYDEADRSKLVDAIKQAGSQAGTILVTPSRRTPAALIDELKQTGTHLWIWDGVEPNPYRGMLGTCDAFLVTGDSHNMVSEVLSTGRQTMVFRPAGLPAKFARFLDQLAADKLIAPVQPANFDHRQDKIDATGEIAEAIVLRLSQQNESRER